jgi:subtilase family serine protease
MPRDGHDSEGAVKPNRRPTHRGARTLVALALASLALVVLVGAAVVVVGSHGHRGQPAASIRSLAAGRARRLGPLARGTIRFAFNLRLRERELDAYLRHVNPGAGPSGRLTAAQFGARFGPSHADLAQLRRLLGQLGITVAHVYPQRTAMLVSSSVARIDRLFSVRFGRYVTADGRPYFAPEGTPRIPAALTPYVTGLGDLSDRPIPADDIPSSGLTPALTAQAYDIRPLLSAGIRGQGQTIAVATLNGAINPADLQAFAQRFGIPAPQIGLVQIDGGSTFTPATGSDSEVDLDLQVILGVAPQAHIIDYQGSDGSKGPQLSLGHSLADIYNRIEQDGQARIVTTSYGLCEGFLASQNPGDQQLIDNALKALEASSVTVFVATGDSGAYACLQAAQVQPASTLASGFTALSVQTPASSPFAISVGGTRLELRSDGSYLTESAWADPLEREGSGGGISADEPRPPWQQGPGVNQPSVNPRGARQVPDVVGPADPSSGFAICGTQPGASAPTCSGGNGGTSAAAPFWAASMLLVQQYAAAHGAGSLARCFAGPILYDLAAKAQPVPPFHQVARGNNGFYDAAPAWNFATGLGSPDVFNLAQDYAAFLRKLPSRSCPF